MSNVLEDALVNKNTLDTCINDALVRALETQREGVEDVSSSDDGDILDLYGRIINPRHPKEDCDEEINEFDNLYNNSSKCRKRCQCLKKYESYTKKMLYLLFYFMILLFVASIWFAIKQKQKYGSYKCLFIWHQSGWFIIPMIVLLTCDIIFFIIGIIYKYKLIKKFKQTKCYDKCCINHKKYNINKNDIDFEGRYENVDDIESDPENQQKLI